MKGIVLARLEVTRSELVVEVEPTERRGVAIEFITSGGRVARTVAGNAARLLDL